jgi:SAM-dependent methyltransferase
MSKASSVKYDNSAYWRGLHQAHPGSLKAVGHPWLSEALNELKYRSEADALTAFLDSHCQLLKDEIRPQIADIGAGTGFWTELLESWFQSQGSAPGFTVVDISEQALALIKGRRPHFETLRADLTTIDPSHFQERFGLVVSFYCLHHLPRLGDFLNGLRFAARSVAPNGILLIMDPILSQPYSLFHEIAFSSHKGNGMPRSLYLIDDVLESEGLARIAFAPAVSFLLNGGIEARSRIGSATTNALWMLLQQVYRSDRVTRAAGGAIRWADRLLKCCALAHSSSLAAYQRQP